MEDLVTGKIGDLDIAQAIYDLIKIEIGNPQEVTDLETFKKYTEGRTPKSKIYFNVSNVIFTSKEDYEYYKFYSRTTNFSFESNTYDIFIYTLAMSDRLKFAIDIMNQDH